MKIQKNEALMSYLRPYCHVNALGHDWQGVLKRDLENCKDEVLAQSVKKEMLEAIYNNGVGLSEMENNTGWDFESEKELVDWFANLWAHIYDEDSKEVFTKLTSNGREC